MIGGGPCPAQDEQDRVVAGASSIDKQSIRMKMKKGFVSRL